MRLGIILTGTVESSVKGGNFTPEERLEMYASTLRYYAKEIGKQYPIYFVENSNAYLSSWSEEFCDKLDLHIMQFRPDDELSFKGFDNSKGKGFNEYLMIKKGIEKIMLTPPHLQPSHLLKITGRYSMLNIKRVIREIESRFSNETVFMGDIKDTCVYEMIGRKTLSSHWGDSRFFAFSLDFYQQYLSDCYLEMNDYKENCWAEHYLLRLSRNYRHDPRFIFRFRTQVRFNGISGTLTSEQLRQGVGNQDSLTNRTKFLVRQTLRFLFPYIWF